MSACMRSMGSAPGWYLGQGGVSDAGCQAAPLPAASILDYPTRAQLPAATLAATYSKPPASFQDSLSRSYVVRVKGSNANEGGGAMAQTEAGYRRKWKKWLAIYLAAAVVVYLIVFLVFFNHGGGGGGYGY